MAKYAFACTCGCRSLIDAPDRNEAVFAFQSALTQQALDEHYQDFHGPTDLKPALQEVQALIRHSVTEIEET